MSDVASAEGVRQQRLQADLSDYALVGELLLLIWHSNVPER